MLQEINLYPFLPKKKGFNLTPKSILMSYGVFLLLLVMFHLIQIWQKHKLMVKLDQLTIDLSLDQQQLAILTQKYPMTDSTALKESIQQLQKEYESKEQSIDLVSPYANFSSYLIGLGTAIIPGVWLTQITFDRGENKISLKGYALKSTLLEKFYRQLEIQPVFSNLEFKVNEIKQTKLIASFYMTARKVNNG